MGPAFPRPFMSRVANPSLAAPEGATHREAILNIGDLNRHHAVLVDDVGLLNEGAILGANHRHCRQIDVGTTQATIKGEDDLAIGLEVPRGTPASSKDEYSTKRK